MNRLIYLIVFILFLLLLPFQAFAALTLDGQTTGGTSIVLTTSNTNDIIIVLYTSNSGVANSGLSDTSGLTWHNRGGGNPASNGNYVQILWAFSASPLSSDTITSANGNRISAFGINGANTTSPFDTNGSLPALAGAISANANAVTLSTSNANDFLFCMIRASTTVGTVTAPSGFTNLNNASQQSNDYDIVSTIQSSVAETYNYSNINSTGLICDAVVAAGGPSPPAVAPDIFLFRGFP